MNIIVLAYKFPPFKGVGARRITSLVKSLSHLGVSIDVITVDWGDVPVDIKSMKNVTLHIIPSNYLHKLHYSIDFKGSYFHRIFRLLYVRFFQLTYCWDDEASLWRRPLLKKVDSVIKNKNSQILLATGHPFQVNYLAALVKKKILI